ncbi:MAG: amidohydrolase family protein [Acidimicrobiia bacterium]
MLDLLITDVRLVDGTGAPERRADVGVRDGRVVLGDALTGDATATIDGTGLVLAPGFIDPHTHYDAQFLWDPYGAPSNLHGVTTTINGNCGFTLAPLRDEDGRWSLEMLAEVEGMPIEALMEGVPADWTSFGDYLDRLDGTLGVNAAFLVGHCALRRYVMGAAGTGNEASDEQIEAMKDELRAALDAGGMGFSSSQSFTHDDGDGNPVPSRAATTDEVLALASVVSEFEGTTLEYITDGCLKGFTDEEIERLTRISLAGKRPLNWNVLTVDSREPDKVERQLAASEYAEEHGARVVALTMPVLVPMNMSFRTRCALTLIPGWDEILTLPIPERMERLRDPRVREKMLRDIHDEKAGVMQRFNRFRDYEIGDTFSEENKPLEGRTVGEIADERGTEPFDALLDIVLVDELRTVLWPLPLEDDDESWRMRMRLIDEERVLIGGSDGGAHLDRMLGSTYPTELLGDTIRGRRLLSLERAVQLITDTPARLFGLRDRGRIEHGAHADLVLFDPDTIGAGPVRMVADLPAGNERLHSRPEGIRGVWVNGVRTVIDNESTGAVPGTVLRSGRDTETVRVPGSS